MEENYSLTLLGLSILVLFYIIRVILSRFHFLMPNRNGTDQAPSIPTSNFDKIFNPYSLKASMISNKEQIFLEVTSHCPSWMHVAWGVLVSEIYPLIQSSPHQLSNTEMLSERISKISLFQEMHALPSDDNIIHKFHLEKPHLDLGPAPRDRYPLVIIIITSDSLSDIPQDCNKIVGLMSFVHLKDSICNADTHIFDQYVKTMDGRLHNIKAVYVSSEESNDGSQAEARGTGTCIVCLSGSIESVLLPCRHACMCECCLQKLAYCPVCRSAIITTFRI